MSHWKTFKNDVLTNSREDILRKALAEMGVELDTSIKSITNPWGHEKVDMGFKKDGKEIALGFKEETNADGSKTLVLKGDFYSTGLVEAEFMDKVSQCYTKNDIIDKIENRTSYTIEGTPTVNENGEIEIIAYTFA